MFFLSSQEYEAKLEELEAALVHQLKTDTAVEKLEEQRQVGGVARGRGQILPIMDVVILDVHG